MRYIQRQLEEPLAKAFKSFPALVLTGPRRAGKTRLLRQLFPSAGYYLLEDPDIVARLRADPQGFLDEIKTPVILDEIQNVPEVFAHVRSRIDRKPRTAGQPTRENGNETEGRKGREDKGFQSQTRSPEE